MSAAQFLPALREAAARTPPKDRASEAQVAEIATLAAETRTPIGSTARLTDLTRSTADFMLCVLRATAKQGRAR